MMIDNFKKFQAQTTNHPLGIEVIKAEGSYIYDSKKKYLDLVAGVSVQNLGHCNYELNKSIINQLKKYSHVMVYGEFVQKPSLKLCKLLNKILPKNLNSTYLTNSGTEAIEAALKLAKRATGRSRIISALNSYHGSTHGSMSVSGFEQRKRAYRPLLPNIDFIKFNCESDISKINQSTSCVILETIQGGAGFIEPKHNFLKKISKKCKEVGALLILDELQTGLGRTGKMFAFEHYEISPDILVLGKSLGGGFPIGAMISDRSLMSKLKSKPILGHITTFGGHPVISQAGLTTLKIILRDKLFEKAKISEQKFKQRLKHPAIIEIRGKGLMLALILESNELAKKLVIKSLEKGLILFWLLYESRAVRITPPLNITDKEIKISTDTILKTLDEIYN
jgi:acetylornithine/N-succinyldiaminopimelate aminotransferase